MEHKYILLEYLLWNIGFQLSLEAHTELVLRYHQLHNLIMIRAGHFQFCKEKRIERVCCEGASKRKWRQTYLILTKVKPNGHNQIVDAHEESYDLI